MRAASWDIEWEVGSPWRTLLRRRDLAGSPLPLPGPVVLEIRERDAPSTSPVRLSVPAVLDDDDPANPHWRLRVSAAQTRALGAGSFEHRLLVTLIEDGEPETWARGWVRARDTYRDVKP